MKRCSCEAGGGGGGSETTTLLVCADDAAHGTTTTTTPTRFIKRSCGRGGGNFYLPPGALPPSSVEQWVCATLGLTCGEAACAAHAHPALALLLDASAELDAALQPHWHTVPASSLKGYVSLTRCDRASLWRKFEPAAPALLACCDAASASAACLLARLLLLDCSERALGGKAVRPLACLTKFTLELPAWMAGWGARWGLGHGREVSVLLVTAYGAASSSSSSSAPPAAAAPPAWRVAIPLLPRLNGGGA